MSTTTSSHTINIMCLGDVVGRAGCAALRKKCKELKELYSLDLIIANGENASGGNGIDPSTAEDLLSFGVDLLTLGDHVWAKREIKDYLNKKDIRCIRPGNYPEGAPGQGWIILTLDGGAKIGVTNLLGRTFLNLPLDCPFKKIDEYINGPLKDCNGIIVDFHCEATSEKIAFGKYLDGRASLVFGTHTHVQTADEEILPNGTGYITDIGMCGTTSGVIGMDYDVAVSRFLSGIPSSYKLAVGPAMLCGIICNIDLGSSRAKTIERIRIPVSL